MSENLLVGMVDPNLPVTQSPERSTESRDDFLRLLVAQMSNQDPLSPVDSQDFAAQLAQFSSLEQLHNINENIKYGVDMDLVLTQTINNTLAATIIGKQAKAIGDMVIFNSSGSADINFHLEADAKDVEVTIKDSAGTVVRELSNGAMRAGDHILNWDGKNTNGETLPEGTYQFSVQAKDVDGNDVSVISLIQGIVTGVRYADGAAVLLIGSQEVSFASVLEIGINDND